MSRPHVSIDCGPWPHWCALFGFLALSVGLANAADLGVRPGEIGTDFQGSIDYEIGDVPPGASVVLERFWDVDGNEMIGGADVLLDRYLVGDGEASRIGGTINGNVPHDTDGQADGRIAAGIAFAAGETSTDRIAGRYLVRASVLGADGEPTETTDVVTLNVVAPATAQTITGTVRSDGVPVGGAWVVALDMEQDGVIAAGATADNQGRYQLSVKPGIYQLAALKPGFVVDLESAPLVEVGDNESPARDIGMTEADREIEAVVRDRDSGKRLSGVELFAEADEGGVTLAWTDEEGVAAIPVIDGIWEVEANEADLAQLGYLVPDEMAAVDMRATSTGSVTVDAIKADSLFPKRRGEQRGWRI